MLSCARATATSSRHAINAGGVRPDRGRDDRGGGRGNRPTTAQPVTNRAAGARGDRAHHDVADARDRQHAPRRRWTRPTGCSCNGTSSCTDPQTAPTAIIATAAEIMPRLSRHVAGQPPPLARGRPPQRRVAGRRADDDRAVRRSARRAPRTAQPGRSRSARKPASDRRDDGPCRRARHDRSDPATVRASFGRAEPGRTAGPDRGERQAEHRPSGEQQRQRPGSPAGHVASTSKTAAAVVTRRAP